MAGDRMQIVMQALLMGTTGAMIAMAAAMWRAPRPLARWVGVVFDLAVAAYALKLWNDETRLLPAPAEFIVIVLATGTVGWFWLFVMTLFEDSCRIRRGFFAAVGLLTVCGVAGQYVPAPIQPWCWVLSNIGQIAMMIHAVATILQGWKGDLVETRRALRGPFLLVVSVYILLLRGFEIWDIFGDPPAWYPMANAGVLAAVCLAGSFVFLESRSDLFGIVRPPESVPNPAARQMAQLSVSTAAVANGHATAPVAANGSGTTVVALDRAEKADLERLECLMAKEEVWREEGLTIASLAHRAQMPEAQLRHLINDRLGYRNFPSYVNAHRIACAKNRLSDPNEARISISTIAYDIGFASLGPFNRAFRDVTGVSPSEWRKTALHEPSPISESA